jgi:hypothetical protein
MSETPSYPLIGLAFMAPLSARERAGGDTIHAVTMDALLELMPEKAHGRTTVTSACGVEVALIGGDGKVAAWPPRIRGVENPPRRCQVCYVNTGRPRPRDHAADPGRPAGRDAAGVEER